MNSNDGFFWYGAASGIFAWYISEKIGEAFGAWYAKRKAQPKVEPYKDERTPLDQLRAEILESLKRGEWEFDHTPTCTRPRLHNTKRNCAMIVYNSNASIWEWNGVPLGWDIAKAIDAKREADFSASRIAEWRNAQPIKNDVDNAPKA